jgi:hypothetical protein
MPTRTVVFDKVGYTKPRPAGDTRPGRLRATARKGDTIEVDAYAAERLDRIGAVVGGDVDVEPNPGLPIELTAEVEHHAAMAAGIVLPDGSGGPNAATREAAMAAARRQAEDLAREGHFGADLALVEVTPGAPAPEPTGDVTVAPVSDAESTVTDAELDAMNVESLLAHLNQHPGDIDRVEDANGRRAKTSKQVTDAVDRVRQAIAEREDEAALAQRDAGTTE